MSVKPETTPAETPAPATPAPNNAPPPAAKVVLETPASETDAPAMVKLRRELNDEREGRAQDKGRIAELETMLGKTTPAPSPAPVKKSYFAKVEGFLNGITILGQD